jgi:hypothetical protein
MSSSVYIPSTSGGGGFTPPASISVKTASYTIPAGRYARVYTECDSGGVFTINAVNAVVTSPFINVDVNTGAATVSYTVPSGYLAALNCGMTNGTTATLAINGNLSIGGNQIQQGTFGAGPGGSYSLVSSSFNVVTLQGVATPSNATNRQATFYVPTGTVISGSGNWKAIVEEYTV